MGNFSNDQSKFKLIIYLKSGQRQCFYSLLNEEKKGDDVAKRGMIRRLLERRFKDKYQTALLYDRISDLLLQKWVDGKQLQIT